MLFTNQIAGFSKQIKTFSKQLKIFKTIKTWVKNIGVDVVLLGLLNWLCCKNKSMEYTDFVCWYKFKKDESYYYSYWVGWRGLLSCGILEICRMNWLIELIFCMLIQIQEN